MFSESEIFALIKSTPQELMLELKLLFKNETDFLLEELSYSKLNSQIISISQSKYAGNNFIIWEPKILKGHSVFYSNYLDGWYTLLYSLAAKYKNEVLIIFLDSIEKKGKMGFYNYCNRKERVVRALYDNSKWTFFEKGEILSFEDIEHYKKRKITDRINNYIVKEYLLKLSINIDNADFYKSSMPIVLGRTM